MAKKPVKAGGEGFFKPRATITRARGDVTDLDASDLPESSYTKGETAILAALEKIQLRLTKVESAVHFLENTIEKMDSRVLNVEKKTDVLEKKFSAIDPQLTDIKDTQKDILEFKEKAIKAFVQMDAYREHLENEKRGATVRILGYQQVQKDKDLAVEIGDFLTNIIDPYGDKTAVKLDKVYRLPEKKGFSESVQGGTIVATLSDRSVREKVLAKATTNRALSSEGGRVLIFPDVSFPTLEKRRVMLDLRKKFLELGAQASLWAPARLRIKYMNRQYAFQDPEAARTLLESLTER